MMLMTITRQMMLFSFLTFSHLPRGAVPCQPYFLTLCPLLEIIWLEENGVKFVRFGRHTSFCLAPIAGLRGKCNKTCSLSSSLLIMSHSLPSFTLQLFCFETKFCLFTRPPEGPRGKIAAHPMSRPTTDKILKRPFQNVGPNHILRSDKYRPLRRGGITCGRTNGNGQVQLEGWSGFTNNIWSVKC